MKGWNPEYKSYSYILGIVSPFLIHLSNNGVTNEDIINLGQTVLTFKNTDFFDNVYPQWIQTQRDR